MDNILTPEELVKLFRDTGFPKDVANTMAALAMRESSGKPDAFNGNEGTHDRSYGLLQINMRDNNVRKLVYEQVLNIPFHDSVFDTTSEKQLFIPSINARAALLLWGGSNKNLDVAWYIKRDGYRQRYECHLPAVQEASLNLDL